MMPTPPEVYQFKSRPTPDVYTDRLGRSFVKASIHTITFFNGRGDKVAELYPSDLSEPDLKEVLEFNSDLGREWEITVKEKNV